MDHFRSKKKPRRGGVEKRCDYRVLIRPDPVIVVYLTFVSAISPGRFVADVVSLRLPTGAYRD